VTVTDEQPAAASRDEAETLARCHAVLARATEHAWKTGGSRVTTAINALRKELRAAENRVYLRDLLAANQPAAAILIEQAAGSANVSCADAAREHLISTIRRECGDSEASYVGGDE
jgi:hypothetical protein